MCAAGAIRAATTVEFGTVALPVDTLTPTELGRLIALSRTSPPRDYPEADSAFLDFAAEISELGPRSDV